MPDANKVTVAGTRIANYALGSSPAIISPASSSSSSSASPSADVEQMVLYADWVTCTQ